ncbi:hypothetical protein PAXINDRAFT_15876 [Paxillus involutus ATCC 200175]|uniref:Uncharacterized protein n=1 Tax=Paxillus involutus ATCC 200175 TaxID=664439 RepID=A0A0C9T6B5_PAXIN|nr:hypothetical protein PAXINDRAFT_15876 [Paxillus involutus ATCC 200175]
MSSQPPDSGPNAPRVAAALDILSKVQNSALAFSTCKFLAFSAPKAVPTTPHHHAEVQAQSQTAPSESLCPAASNITDAYPPETQALPASSSLSGSPPAAHTTLPHRPHDLPIVRVFGGGTHAEGADAASMSPSTSLVPASTIDIHPPKTQAPTPPSNTLPASPSLDGSAPATTPRTPRDLPVVRVFSGGTCAEGVDSASTLPSTAAPASNTPSKWPFVQGVLRGPTRKDFVRGPASKFCTASPYLHEEPVPTTTSPDSETRGTEARSLETLPENQPLVNPSENWPC